MVDSDNAGARPATPSREAVYSPREIGISLGQAAENHGRVTLLAKRYDYSSFANVLLVDFEQNGFQNPTLIKLKGTLTDCRRTLLSKLFSILENFCSGVPSIGSMTIDNQGSVWVGGGTDFYIGMASDQHSRAYLARLDSAGASIWEKSYKTGSTPFVVSLTPASTGDTLVAADDVWFRSSWLAMIAASDGAIVWETHIGKGKGVAVARTAENAFLIADFGRREPTQSTRRRLQSVR